MARTFSGSRTFVGGGGSYADVPACITTANPGPDVFIFTDQNPVARSTLIESDSITVENMALPAFAYIDNGEMSINGGAWTSYATQVSQGDTIQLRMTSSGEYETATSMTLYINNEEDTWTITSAAHSGVDHRGIYNRAIKTTTGNFNGYSVVAGSFAYVTASINATTNNFRATIDSAGARYVAAQRVISLDYGYYAMGFTLVDFTAADTNAACVTFGASSAYTSEGEWYTTLAGKSPGDRVVIRFRTNAAFTNFEMDFGFNTGGSSGSLAINDFIEIKDPFLYKINSLTDDVPEYVNWTTPVALDYPLTTTTTGNIITQGSPSTYYTLSDASVILNVGDSWTAGNLPYWESYNAKLRDTYSRQMYIEATAGYTLAQIKTSELDPYIASPYYDNTQSNVALTCLIGGGTNDIAAGASLADLQSRLGDILTVCDANNLIPCILNIPPRNGFTSGQNTIKENYNTWLAGLGRYYVDIHTVVEDSVDNTQIASAYNFDGTHVNTAGGEACADAIETVLLTIDAATTP